MFRLLKAIFKLNIKEYIYYAYFIYVKYHKMNEISSILWYFIIICIVYMYIHIFL